jgi:hypothetical protein
MMWVGWIWQFDDAAQQWTCIALMNIETTEKNPVAWVRERTLPPSDRRLSAKLVQTIADRRCHVVSVTDPYGHIRFSRPEPATFLSSRSSVVLTKAEWTPSRPTASQKIWKRRESNLDLCICSQELWPQTTELHGIICCCCYGYKCFVQELTPRNRVRHEPLSCSVKRISLLILNPWPNWQKFTTGSLSVTLRSILVYPCMYTGHPSIPFGFASVISHSCATCPVHPIAPDLISQIIFQNNCEYPF